MLWGIQVAAVVIGHVIGAWAGHASARADVTRADAETRQTRARTPRPARADSAPEKRPVTASSPSQVPLALLMIGLTSLTLWSLGQNLVFIPAGSG